MDIPESGLLDDEEHMGEMAHQAPHRPSRMHKVVAACGVAALFLAGYALGTRSVALSQSIGREGFIEQVGEPDAEPPHSNIHSYADFQQSHQGAMIRVDEWVRARMPTHAEAMGAIQQLNDYYKDGQMTQAQRRDFDERYVAHLRGCFATLPFAPPATAAGPPHSAAGFRSYADFQHSYQAAMNVVDQWVRARMPPHAQATQWLGAIQQLNDYYHGQMTEADRKDFDEDYIAALRKCLPTLP